MSDTEKHEHFPDKSKQLAVLSKTSSIRRSAAPRGFDVNDPDEKNISLMRHSANTSALGGAAVLDDRRFNTTPLSSSEMI